MPSWTQWAADQTHPLNQLLTAHCRAAQIMRILINLIMHISDKRFLQSYADALQFKGVDLTKHGEVKMTDAEFCHDLDNEWLASSWSKFKLAAGSVMVSKWIKDNGLKRCKKSEATAVLVVGNKCKEVNAFVAGGFKNYWLCANVDSCA